MTKAPGPPGRSSADSAWVPSYFTAVLPLLLHTSPLVLVSDTATGVWVYVCVHVHVCTHIQRPQVGITYAQQLFPPQLLRQGLSLCSELSEQDFLAGQCTPGILSSAEVTVVYQLALFLHRCWGSDELAWQALYSWSQLPTKVFKLSGAYFYQTIWPEAQCIGLI